MRLVWWAGTTIKLLQSAAELNPGFYNTRSALGREYLLKGMVVQAIQEFQAAPDLPSLGFAYALSGQKRAAQGVLERMRASPLEQFLWFRYCERRSGADIRSARSAGASLSRTRYGADVSAGG